MVEQLEQVDLNSESYGDPAWEVDAADSSVAREHDPVLAALAAAPWVPLSADDEATLEEIERSVARWIPAGEFVAALDASAAATE